MSGIAVATPRAKGISASEESVFSKLIRFIFIALFDVGAILFIRSAVNDGFLQLAVVLGVITVMVNLIFLIPAAYPFRWMAIGLSTTQSLRRTTRCTSWTRNLMPRALKRRAKNWACQTRS